jgi:hypothetical protein
MKANRWSDQHWCVPGGHWYPCPEDHEQPCLTKSQIPCKEHREEKP